MPPMWTGSEISGMAGSPPAARRFEMPLLPSRRARRRRATTRKREAGSSSSGTCYADDPDLDPDLDKLSVSLAASEDQHACFFSCPLAAARSHTAAFSLVPRDRPGCTYALSGVQCYRSERTPCQELAWFLVRRMVMVGARCCRRSPPVRPSLPFTPSLSPVCLLSFLPWSLLSF